MVYIFYDTSALLEKDSYLFENSKNGGINLISSIVLKELEDIKSSNKKDEETKYKARRLLRTLSKNRDKYELYIYEKDWDTDILNTPTLCLNNDGRLIYQAKKIQEDLAKSNSDFLFVTNDLGCYEIANAYGVKSEYCVIKIDEYNGYSHIACTNDDEIAATYEALYTKENSYDIHINEYLLITDNNQKIIDHYKWNGKEYSRIPDFYCFESKMFGKVKPQTSYQLIAMDALSHNKMVMLRGKSGSGKSLLSLAYLYQELEKGNLDKIIIFCNTVAAKGAAKLGFYPGDRTEKLLDSSIGNFLVGKFGAIEGVEQEIHKGRLLLLPLADIRGFDTTGMKAGIYVTEAQNMDIELMRLALQRIGEDCICILDGDDASQVDMDMYAGSNNGMKRVSEVFRGTPWYSEVRLPQVLRSDIAALADKL